MIKKKCLNALWFSVEANRTTPKHFFFILKTRFFAHFFTPKNTLVIVAQILLYNIYLYIILRYRKEIHFKRTKRFLYPNAILLRYVLIHKIFSNRIRSKHSIYFHFLILIELLENWIINGEMIKGCHIKIRL